MPNDRIYMAYSNINANRTPSSSIYGIDVIKQDIINLLMTRKGSFPGDVRRGVIIHEYLFQPTINSYEENLILSDAQQQLSEDPRFDINEMYLIMDEETQTLIMSMNLFIKPFNRDIELSIPFRTE